jgi:tetratricopeptide (TPR) repeat protein
VSTDQDDWDREERQALAGLGAQIDAMRRRHAGDPPIELLRAARADVLPEDLQTAVSEHLAASAMSRTLADGCDDEPPALSDAEQERLLARIVKEASASASAYGETGRERLWGWLRPVLVGSGIVAIASLVWVVSKRTEVGERLGPPDTQVVVALPPAVPPFLLPFEKPDVRLGMGALTWRGSKPTSSDDGNQLLADMKPGLDAYRQNDYAAANRELTALASRYPGTIEILFYQGVSRLFLNDYAGAIASFEAAEAIGDRTFAGDVAWYRAVAEQRSGRAAEARSRLDAICSARDDRNVRLQPDPRDAVRACTALEQLAAPPANPQ